MVLHKCDKCDKIFKKKCNFIRHQNRKNSCIQLHPDYTIKKRQGCKNTQTHIHAAPKMRENKSKIVCQFCDTNFTRKYSLTRHINFSCKVKKDIHLNAESKYIEHKYSTNTNIDKQINNICDTVNQINNVNKVTNNQVNNVTTNNINIVCFGQEDMEKLGDDTIMKILNKGFMSIPHLTQLVHFNEKYPEFHNMYIANLRDSNVAVYDDDVWLLTERNPIIEQIYTDKRDFLIEKYSDLHDKLPASTIRKFNRFLEQHNDSDVSDAKKRQIKLLLYNKRDIAMETRKKYEKNKKVDNKN